MTNVYLPRRIGSDRMVAEPVRDVDSRHGYLPIRDYALIGDCHGCALVSRTGSIDWCAFGRFDAPPIFCRVLDVAKGGFISVTPVEEFSVERSYIDSTNILRTVFTTTTGTVAVTDYMPVGRQPGSSAHDYVSLSAPILLIRTVEGIEGNVSLDIGFRPSIDYARAPVRLLAESFGLFVEDGPALYSEVEWTVVGDLALGKLNIAAGQQSNLIVAPARLSRPPSINVISRLWEITRAFWSEWSSYCRYQGRYRDIVRRSALTLKLLTYAPTGAIVAAATTSLPEEVGGERNWDYRYCWLRDASFTLYALAVLGYSGEARAFGQFLKRVCRKRPGELQIMYGVGEETQLDEQNLAHLDGYRGSRPVRVGNAAYRQHQIDVYGEFVDLAHSMAALGGKSDNEDRALIAALVSFVAAHIDEPEHGLWEARSAPRHYVYGKMMGWVALDRGLQMLGYRPVWSRLKDSIRDQIHTRGTDPSGDHLLQAYDCGGSDAALLLAPMLGFPLDRRLLEGTVAAVERDLRHGDYVRRYNTDDGLDGGEGHFLICSFWLVNAYLALGRGKQARALFERLIKRGNDVDLFAEEIDAVDHAFLGNFPQAFTHLALIGNAIHLDLYETFGAEGVSGTDANRARRAVGATFGWRALWEACKASGRVGRFWSSRKSILPRSVARGLHPHTSENGTGVAGE